MSVDLRDNTVAQYKMNDNLANKTVIDAQRFSNGSNFVNTNTKEVVGKINGALNFNGTADFIDTNSTFQSTFQDSFSINFWFNTTNTLPTPGPDYLCGAEDDGGDEVSIFYFNNLLIFDYKAGGVTANNNGPATFISGQWHMITFTFNKTSSTTMQIIGYLNGSPIFTLNKNAIDMSSFTMARNFYIAAGNAGAAIEHTNGQIDNFCIFSKTLTQEEIDFLYNEGNGTESLYDITEDVTEHKFFATIGDFDTRNLTPNNASKLLFSFVEEDTILRTANDDFRHIMVKGFPLSVSPCFFSNQTTKFRTEDSRDFPNLTYFYALDVIAADQISHQTLTDEERTTQFYDAKLFKNRWNAVDYLNTVNTGCNAIPTDTTNLFGSTLGLGKFGELLFNNTPYSVSEVDEIKEVAFMNNLISVGRVGNDYYLIITT